VASDTGSGSTTGLEDGPLIGPFPGPRVDFVAGSEPTLAGVQAGRVGVGAADAEPVAVGGLASADGRIEALGTGKGEEAVLDPALSDLVELLVHQAVDIEGDEGV